MPSPWEQDFDTYMSEMDDLPASFVVDLAAPLHAPLESHPLALLVTVPLLQPLDNGLRSADEFDAMGELEDRVVENLTRALDAVYVGRVVHDGATTFYFYLPRLPSEELSRIPQHAGDLGAYSLEWSVEEDEEWEHCSEFLAPDTFSHHLIMNRRLLTQMGEAGDHVDRARKIDHFAYFGTREAAEGASEALRGAGFEVEEASESPDDEEEWGLEFHRVDVPGDGGADAFVEQILELIEPFEGIYDGWGSPVVQG